MIITHIQKMGNELAVLIDDGGIVLAHPTGGSLWKCVSNPYSLNVITRYGNQLCIQLNSGIKFLAYQTTSRNLFIVNGVISDPEPVASWMWPLALTPAPHTSQNWGGGTVGTHTGLDLVYPGIVDDAILAISDSTVVGTTTTVGNGRIIKMKAADNTYYAFYHMSAFVAALTAGVTVGIGDTLGYVGDSGTNVDPGAYHMHFVTSIGGWTGIQVNSAVNTVNPKTYMSDRGMPYPWPT